MENTIIQESESITAETQTSFVKTIHIPENLNQGEYIFGVVARYGSSVGTSTFLFEVASPEETEKKDLLDYYKENKLVFWTSISILIIITLLIIGWRIYLPMRLFFHDKLHFSREKQIKKEIKREGISKKEMLTHLYIRLLENFRRLTRKEKIFILIMIFAVSLIILISVLIGLGVLSTEQLGMGNVLLKTKSISSTPLGWIIKYYLHMIIVALLITTIVSAYLKRDIIIEHKKLFWTVLIIIIFILIALIIFLLYNRITTFAQLSQI